MEEHYQPMYDRAFEPAMREWIAAWDAWERGERADCAKGETMPYWEWNGAPPDPAYYRPDWPESERTHLMMYEDTSEGTPISPAFTTPEELIAAGFSDPTLRDVRVWIAALQFKKSKGN